MSMTEKKLLARDSKRNIGAELLASVLEMKAGKSGRVHRVSLSDVTQARTKSGLSQSQFAQVLGKADTARAGKVALRVQRSRLACCRGPT